MEFTDLKIPRNTLAGRQLRKENPTKIIQENLNIRIDHLIQCSAYSTMFSNYSGIPVEQIAVAQVTKIGFNTQIKIEKPQNYFHLFEQKLKYYYKMKNDLNIR